MNMEKIAVLEPEVVATQLAKVEKEAGLTEDNALALRNEFGSYYNDIVVWRGKAALITDPADVTHQKIARDVRLGLKNIRCEVEGVRKSLKAESLARGKAIDGMANVLKYLCEPIEAQLLDVETYVEKQEAARIAVLISERTRKLAEFGVDPSAYNLGAMDEPTFNIILDTMKKQKEEREATIKKAEADRIAKEQAEAFEREKMRIENERLRKEAAERDAKERKEREKIESERQKEREVAAKKQLEVEAKAKAERDAREKLEREAAEAKRKEDARIAAEQAAIEAKAKTERDAALKAKRAPDKDKIKKFAKSIMEVCAPEMSTDDGRQAMVDVIEKQAAFTQWILKQAESL